MNFALDHRSAKVQRTLGTKTCAANAQNDRTYSSGASCKCVTFHKRGGRPVHVWRCSNRKLRAHNKNQCRARTGRSRFERMQFVPRLANGKCPRRA